MKKNIVPFLALALAASLPTLSVHAQLKITEVQSSESGGDPAGHDDWWELTNFGAGAVNLGGYKFNDSTGSFTNQFFSLPSITIAPGESIIFVESTAGQPMTVQGFRDWWGAGLNPATQITVYSMGGIGLSSTGDQVNLWDASNTLVDNVNFGAATAGVSFEYAAGLAGRLPVGLSQLGVNGAFASIQNGDIGSPGVVPEPTVCALLGLGVAAFLIRRRRQ